jgi:TPR repeat protein
MHLIRSCALALLICSPAFAASKSERAAYEAKAAKGDTAAMIELGLMHHRGEGVPVDYAKAMDWYLKAYEKLDGDAFNNLGVMYRDGLAVQKNLKIAYLLFLAVHMEGLGDEGTQMRAGRNLSRLTENLSEKEIHEALSYTWPYVDQIVKSRGKNTATGKNVLPAKDRPRIRDNDWWLDSERKAMIFDSPPPWDKAGD